MPERLNWRRGILVGASLISALILIAIIAVLVLTGTDWGRERVRRFAQNQINGMIHGKATIGRLSGNLLVGMTVHDLAITDSAGEPFVAVESFKANYDILGLVFRKHIWIEDAVLVRPLIVLDRPPGGKWNWQRIFVRSTAPTPPNQPPSWGAWLRFTNAAVVNGQLIVRTPWAPNANLSATQRDSAIRDVLGGGSRLMVQRAAGGFQKIIQLDSVTGAFPLVRLSDPGQPYRLLEVSALAMHAFPFRPPGAVVLDLKGVFPFTNDSIWWKGVYAALPGTHASGDGSYAFGSGDMRLAIHADPATFADFRWLYPRLPAGHGRLDFRVAWHGAIQDYLAYNADVTMGAAHAAGSFGITLGDTLTIHNTNVRFSGLDTRTLEQLIPHLSIPRRGVLAGRAEVNGGRHALTVNGDVTFDDQRAGVSRVIASGGIGFLPHGLRASALHVQLLPLQVAMIHTWKPSLPIGGTLSGTATLNGSTNTQLAMAGDVELRDRGTESALSGTGTIRLAGATSFDIDVNAHPVSLVELGRFAPSIGLQGSAAGPLHLTGTLADLHVQTDLRLPDGGRFAAHGALNLASAQKAYDLTARLYTVNLRTIDSKAPVTSLTANAMVRGRGTQLATMRTTIVADLSASKLNNIAVDSISLRGTIVDGLANIERLYAAGANSVASVAGSFGLVRGRSGTLTYVVDVDSLGTFNRYVPRTVADTGVVRPRPQVMARAIARARADSARIARATEMQRMISGAPGPRLVVNAPAPVPRDTMAGTVHAAGRLSGNIYDFDLRGRAAGDSVLVRGNFVRAFRAEYAWENARTAAAKLAVGLDADSVSAMGFAFDTARVRFTYAPPGGHVELALRQGDNRVYGANGDFALYTDRSEVRLADMRFRFDTVYWSMPHPSTITWGGPGIRVAGFELRNRRDGRIYANGLLPTKGTADFVLAVDNFPASNITDILQTDLPMAGVITLHGSMTGTLSAPAFRGAFGIAQGSFNGTAVPPTRATFAYADHDLVTHLDALSDSGRAVATLDGHLPINLALTGVTGSRLLPGPLAVDLVGDSLPIGLIPQFTDLVANVQGHAAGKISVRGTLQHPTFVGAMLLSNGAVKILSTGATITNMAAAVRLANDTVYVDSLVGRAKGSVRLRGTLAMTGAKWTQPAFNLYLVSNNAQLLNNDWGRLQIDAGLALTGPFDDAYLSGAATITQGVIYAPETGGRHVIGPGDPALFAVLDTSVIAQRELFPPVSPLLANLRMDVSVNVHHDTWVRNREANIEIYTNAPISIHEEQQALALTGIVTTDRGEYNFLSKRFQIKRGSAMFVGSPDLNPTLQITGEYQVEVASRGAINISVIIGGTLRKPALTLSSDAQPPRTQSELLSLLAFGQSETSLLSFNSSSIAGTAATNDLFGVGAQVAVQRLAGVALGVAVDQLETAAGRAFGTDVFDITPADVPAGFNGNTLGNFLTQTRFEAGKYINGRTYVSATEQAGRPGLTIDHRTADGWRFDFSVEPRVLLLEPNLTSQPIKTVQSYGGFVIRDWRF